MKLTFMAAFTAIFILSSCDKDSGSNIKPGDTGSIEIEFDNVVGEEDLELNTGTYTNGSNETYSVATFNYYISNLKLKTTDGKEYIVPKDESYFLIREKDESSHSIELDNVPAGDYSSFTFTVGIDAQKAGAPLAERTGVLDPSGQALDMYKTADEKYIFLKLEGTSAASTAPENKFAWQLGETEQTVTIAAPFESSAKVRKEKDHAPAVHIFADIAKIFDGSSSIDIAGNSIVDFDAGSTAIIANYSAMFNIDHIHNY